MKDEESANRITGIMTDQIRRRLLVEYIYAAIATQGKIKQLHPWYGTGNLSEILLLSDMLHRQCCGIAYYGGVSVFEAEKLIAGKNYQAAELMARQIGRGVLLRLGYQLPEEEGMEMDDWIDTACQEAKQRQAEDAERQAREAAEAKAAKDRSCKDALNRIFIQWGIPLEAFGPFVDLPYCRISAWDSQFNGREDWKIIIEANGAGTQYNVTTQERDVFASRLRDLREGYQKRNG